MRFKHLQVAALAATSLSVILTSKMWKKKALLRKVRRSNVFRNRQMILDEIKQLPSYYFKSMFRMDRNTFDILLTKVKPHLIESNPDIAKRSVKNNHGEIVPIETKLLATLRYLAGGSHWDISFMFKIGFGTFFANSAYGVVWPMLKAIDNAFKIGLDVNNIDQLQKQAEEFAAICPTSQDVFSGVVLAIDGWVMQTRQPYKREISSNDNYVNSFRNRKGLWGIVVLAGCDARTKFHLFSAANTGSTNDCTAWDRCKLKEVVVDNNSLPNSFYFIGDEAFSCSNQFLVPWGGVGIGRSKDSFNYHLSVRRQVIERAFGILTKRWGIFWRPIFAAYDKWSLIATAAAKLHNLCIDQNSPIVPRFANDWSNGDSNDIWLNDIFHAEDGNVPIVAHGSTTGSRRKSMTDRLRVMGILRPAHAMSFTKA